MLTTIAMERNGANMDVSKAKIALKLSLNEVHRSTAKILQAIEDGQDAYVALQTLRSEFAEVWFQQEALERALDRLGLLNRLSEAIKEAV